jgi:hypothetical protein
MTMRSLSRSIATALALTVLATVPAFADPAILAPGDTFPALAAGSVSGAHVALPADVHGAPFVAIFGFSQKAGEATAKWSRALDTTLPPSIAIYAVADLSHVPGLFRGFAIRGIRKAASPTQPEHRNHLLLLTDKNDWSQIVPRGSDDDAVIVEVDGDAKVTTIVRIAYSDAAAGDLAKSVPHL